MNTAVSYLYSSHRNGSRSTLPFSFSIEFSLLKVVHDTVSGEQTYAQTWDSYRLGTHGDSEGFVLSAIYQVTGEFIDKWYQVNKPNGKCVGSGNPFAEALKKRQEK